MNLAAVPWALAGAAAAWLVTRWRAATDDKTSSADVEACPRAAQQSSSGVSFVETMLQNCPAPAFVIDANLRVTGWTQSMYDVTLISEADVRGASFASLPHASSIASHRAAEIIRHALDEPPRKATPTLHLHLSTRLGNVLLAMTATPFASDGARARRVLVIGRELQPLAQEDASSPTAPIRRNKVLSPNLGAAAATLSSRSNAGTSGGGGTFGRAALAPLRHSESCDAFSSGRNERFKRRVRLDADSNDEILARLTPPMTSPWPMFAIDTAAARQIASGALYPSHPPAFLPFGRQADLKSVDEARGGLGLSI